MGLFGILFGVWFLSLLIVYIITKKREGEKIKSFVILLFILGIAICGTGIYFDAFSKPIIKTETIETNWLPKNSRIILSGLTKITIITVKYPSYFAFKENKTTYKIEK